MESTIVNLIGTSVVGTRAVVLPALAAAPRPRALGAVVGDDRHPDGAPDLTS